MIDETDPNKRHREVRVHYERTVDHYDEWFSEVQEDLDFYDGNQWEEADVQYLQQQNRPVLTWNLTQGKILHLIGAHEDNMQEAVVAPNGPEDEARAKILDYIKRQVYREGRMDDVDADVFEWGVKAGISGCAIDVAPDPDNRDRVQILFYPVHPVEVLWDYGSDRKDKSDAGFLFWQRWLTQPEFKTNYPDFADKIEEIMNQRDGDSGIGFTEKTDGFGHYHGPDMWSWSPRRDLLYYDRRKGMVRVIRMEYKKLVYRTEMVGPNGVRREIPPKLKPFIQKNYPQIRVETYPVEKFFWFEFTGHFTLYDDASPLPYHGFSVEPYICAADDANLPYGKVRMLKDPQREVNKRYSQTLHMVNTQIAPGIFAETGAVSDRDAAKASLKQAQSITWLNDGAIAQNKIKERGLPTFPDAIARLHDTSVRMFDFISGISADDMVEPRGIPEAAATTQLKHRRSMMSTKPLLRRFWVYKRNVAIKVLQILARAVPDAQIEDYLANSDLYKVQRGMVLVGQGQQRQAIDFRDLRSNEMNVELRPASTNETERLLELQVLMALLQFQIPVMPDVLFDMLGLPKEQKERLKLYARQMAMSQSQAQKDQLGLTEKQLETQAFLDLIGKGVDVEKTLETHRHNLAGEYLQALKQGMDTHARMEELWERASDDQRRAIIDLVAARQRAKSAVQPGPEAMQ